MNNKQKTVAGLFWSFIESFSTIGIQFVIGIILARILSVREFGLIGLLTLFMNISLVIIDSGFKVALIRKQDCDNRVYSTVFFFNISVSFALYLVLFASAELISNFFAEPVLINPLRVISLGLIFNSLGLIQSTILIKNLDFKKQTGISVTAIVISGIMSVTMAFYGFGIWSLVVLSIARSAINTILLWIKSTWRPAFIFSKAIFKEIYSFSKNLLLSGLLSTIYENAYYFIIGKYFSTVELGHYTRAEQFKYIPSQGITEIISRVSFPVLSSVQNDKVALKQGYRKLIRVTMFISFVFMIGMASIAKPLITVLIGTKWLTAAEYLQLLSFVGMVYPLQALNLNMIQIQGRSDIYLRLDIIKKSLAVPVIIVGIIFGIKYMLMGMIVNTLISYALDGSFGGRYINYPIKEQLMDILPSFFVALVMGAIILSFRLFFSLSPLILLLSQLAIGFLTVVIIGEVLKKDEYLEIKSILKQYLSKIKG